MTAQTLLAALFLSGCYGSVIDPMADAGMALDDAGTVLDDAGIEPTDAAQSEPDASPDAGSAELDAGADAGPTVCEPDAYEPDDIEPYALALSAENRRQVLSGTWHDTGPDRIRATVPADLATVTGQIFEVYVDGAGELTLSIRCLEGDFVGCTVDHPDAQTCQISEVVAFPGLPGLEIEGSCSTGEAVIELDATPASDASCERDIRVEVQN